MKVKTFLKIFLICLVLFTLIFIPITKAVSNINVFEPESTDTREEDEVSLGVLVDNNSSFFQQFGSVKRINLLMVGVNAGMTDTIMLLSWDMDHDDVDVISVPRDTYYHRTGYDGGAERKINAIYSSQGIQKTAEAVSDVLYGIPINYYAIIDYESVKTIVDGIGGVPIDVEQDMHYEDPYDTPPLVIDIEKGHQTLDGAHAVQYLRYRHGYKNGDLGRVEAQQKFVKALYKQCLEHGVISSTKLVCNNIKSDLTLGAISKYAFSAMKLEKDAIQTYTLPGEGKYVNEVSYFIQEKEETKAMLKQIYSNTPSEEDASSDDESNDEEN